MGVSTMGQRVPSKAAEYRVERTLKVQRKASVLNYNKDFKEMLIDAFHGGRQSPLNRIVKLEK